MNRPRPPSPYTLKRVRDMLGLSRAMLTGLISAGVVEPTRGPRNERRFSFQDLMLLRTAHGLQQAGIKPRKILRALDSLKQQLPQEMPLTGLRISAIGCDVAVQDRLGHLDAATGQWLMAFDVAPMGASVAMMPAAQAVLAAQSIQSPQSTQAPLQPSAPRTSLDTDWFGHAEACEAVRDVEQAELAYRRALRHDPADLRCYLNLGALLCDADRTGEAAALYKQALTEFGPHPLLHFNHGVAQEGNADPAAALVSYQQALALDAALADAHYNVGALLQRQGDSRGALRHFSAYRRLTDKCST